MNETYIGYGIHISLIKLMNELCPGVNVDPAIFDNDSEEDNDEADNLYIKLENTMHKNLIWGLKLKVLRKTHTECQNTCYFGIFVQINDHYEMNDISDETYDKIKNLYNETFKNKCEEVFGLTPIICSVSCGCNCCS